MRSALITGASSGIGRATAITLAKRGFEVVIAARSTDRLRQVVEEIDAFGGSARPLFLDLASLEQVRQASSKILDSGIELDVLINNAGIGRARGTTVDGFESHFGVNHLGHFLLTRLIEPSLTSGSRIVNVASAVHHRAPGIDFGALTGGGRRSMFGIEEYAISKLCNILFTAELARRRPHLRTYAVHPGLVATGMFPGWLRSLWSRRMATPEQGASTSLWVATDPTLSDESGRYYAGGAEKRPSQAAQDVDLATELWVRSEQWSGLGE